MPVTLKTTDRAELLAEVARITAAMSDAATIADDLMDERDDLFLAIQEDPSVSVTNVELAAAAGVSDGRVAQAQAKAKARRKANGKR